MLVSFSVGNFRSFGEEVTLNMIAENRFDDHRNHLYPLAKTGKHLVRAAVIYGANAAGKSNLVKAMRSAQSMIVDGEFPTFEPFVFGENQLGKETSIEFRFLIGDQVFAYGFDVERERIAAEWLSLVKGDNKDVVIFERGPTGISTLNDSARTLFNSDPTMFETLGVLKSLPLTEHQLFLNRASSIPKESLGTHLSRIIQWLTEDLVILRSDFQSCEILDRLQNDVKFHEFSKQFLTNVATGIADLKVFERERTATDWERKMATQAVARGSRTLGLGCEGDSDLRPHPTDPTKVITRMLFSVHAPSSSERFLPFFEESDGTKQLLHFLPVIYPSTDTSKTVVIDEIDRSLHPLLCWEFIRFFSESCEGSPKQLIVTTHEAHLLDQELLRRDEYWFVEKDQTQQSRLVSLSEFNIRKDLQIQKGYLQGRFGAIPVIGGMDRLERLLDCGGKEAGDNATQDAPA